MNLNEEIGVRKTAEVAADKRAADYQKSLGSIDPDVELRAVDDEFDYAMQDDFVDIMQPVIWLVVALILIAVATR